MTVKPELHPAVFLTYAGCAIPSGMGSKRTYLAAWRRYRHLTQSQVVDRLAAFEDPKLPQTAASLSRLENGKQPYNQRILEALADIYQTNPGALITHDPSKEGRVIDLLHRLTPADRGTAEAMLDAMVRIAESRTVNGD